ncbi:hypothetical protein [Acetobacter okinawensis]|uniref:hypothetical protein n=1 Tax=Acetobacter okinawensis TaxID=1076594 RepID=UPI00131F0A9E|nr:hypothetical protein [Acetobacter okinawensis]
MTQNVQGTIVVVTGTRSGLDEATACSATKTTVRVISKGLRQDVKLYNLRPTRQDY